METIYIKKNKISYTDDGKGSPIIFLPGIDGKNNIWENQIYSLSMNYRVITIDFSEIIQNSVGIGNILDIINELTDLLRIDYFFIAGYSVGALFALLFANRYPDKISGVCISSLGNILTDKTKNKSDNTNLTFNFFQKLKNLFIKKSCSINIKFKNLLKYHTIMQEYTRLNHPLLLINGQYDYFSSHNISSSVYNMKSDNPIRLEIIEKAKDKCFSDNPNIYNHILKEFIMKYTSSK